MTKELPRYRLTWLNPTYKLEYCEVNGNYAIDKVFSTYKEAMNYIKKEVL
jgi:hypothetical protein